MLLQTMQSADEAVCPRRLKVVMPAKCVQRTPRAANENVIFFSDIFHYIFICRFHLKI